MSQERFTAYRRRLVSAAEGRVLEIGLGSGLNLPFYPARVTNILGLDPSAALLSRVRVDGAPPVILLKGSGEHIPLERASVDTVVVTWTLCSVPHAPAALGEIRRVLRPTGRLLFVEHGLAPDLRVARWQRRLTPLWKRVAGGCHLDRPVDRLIVDAGFRLEQLETGYMPGPRPMTFMYEGSARPL